jgi:opacity protein-like surface antigen
MKSSRILAGVSFAALMLGAQAAAAQTGPWTGFYLGGHAGAASHDEEDSETILFDRDLNGTFGDVVTTSAGANAFSPGFCGGRASGNSASGGCEEDEDSGADFGVRAGYDRQFGALVIGGLVEISTADLEDNVSAFSSTPAAYTMTREVDSVLAARLRAGYAFNRYLAYVTGGVASGRLSRTFATTNTANTFALRGEDSDVIGGQIGLGAEASITPRLSIGVEYLSTRFEADDFRVRAQGPAPATNPFILGNANGTDFRRSDEDFRYDSLRVTASYRF